MDNVGRGQSNGELDIFADEFLRCWGCNPSGRRWVRKKNTQEAGKGYLRALLLPGVMKSVASKSCPCGRSLEVVCSSIWIASLGSLMGVSSIASLIRYTLSEIRLAVIEHPPCATPCPLPIGGGRRL